MKEFYETYKVYLTRKNLEIAALVVIVLSALLVFLSAIPGQGVLTLDKGAIRYDGSLVRGKFKSKDGWTYEGQFVNGQPEGKGTLTTEANVVYKGTFKQGIYQNAH
mgnify:CR=1 FL=1